MYKSGTVFGHPAQVVNIPLGLTFQNIKILKPKKIRHGVALTNQCSAMLIILKV